MRSRRRASVRDSRVGWKPALPPESKPLLRATDNGSPVVVPVQHFASPQRDGGWGGYAETFLRFNDKALRSLDVEGEVAGTSRGPVVRLVPHGRAGAVPLRSGYTGRVSGGLLVAPRFGWTGIGQVLHDTGWWSAPELLGLPTVPGSAREIPPWVLAGPVLVRLERLLGTLRPGYRQLEAMSSRPRGRILWHSYISRSLSRGHWDQIPCRFPDLAKDPLLRRYIRWTLERVLQDLCGHGEADPVAGQLITDARRLVDTVSDVAPLMPRPNDLEFSVARGLASTDARLGIEAMQWVVDERGLGGGRERDGLAWTLPLDRLWESFVEATYRHEVSRTGGEILVGRLSQTVFPLEWTDPTHRSLGHLVPDLVVRRGRSVQIVDAKYKAHLAELDEVGWRRFEDEIRDSHRADIHQVLAYASLYEAEDVTATLVYPLRRGTYLALRDRRRDRSYAELLHGGRRICLELRGLPFGRVYG
ncbi:hypothetical protein ACFLUT_03260 [Chloroflexota bacterium]